MAIDDKEPREKGQRSLNVKARSFMGRGVANMSLVYPIEEAESDNSLVFPPPVLVHNGPFYQQLTMDWPYFRPYIQNLQPVFMNTLAIPFYPSNVNSPVLANNEAQNRHQNKEHIQEFEYFLVIDFEATCDKEKVPSPQEIIEFPCVLVNGKTGKLEDSFQTYVRPSHHHQLSDFCKELTGINQAQVDNGVSLSEALLLHDDWLESRGVKGSNFAVVTWSNWDCRVMLESECRFKKIRKPPYFNRWINLKVAFREIYGANCKLKDAVQMAGFEWKGRQHSGIVDAQNTARLLSVIMGRDFKLVITNSLPYRPEDQLPWAPERPASPALPARVLGPTPAASGSQFAVESYGYYCLAGYGCPVGLTQFIGNGS